MPKMPSQPKTPAFYNRLQSNIVTCTPKMKGVRIHLKFSSPPPDEPGVYVVYLKSNGLPFYVGEAKNLLQRLTYLFRCHRNDNPHPCHRRHEEVWEELPDCEDFCDTYAVRWMSTQGMIGRLEVEENLITHFRTNTKEFYLNFEQKMAAHAKGGKPVTPSNKVICCAGKKCSKSCPVWHELMTNPAYQTSSGFVVPTLTGKKDNLVVRVQPKQKMPVNVHRPGTSLSFDFNEADCLAICQRYEQGLQQGKSFSKGGTSFFNQPKWSRPTLGNIHTPYAATVIRSARQSIGLPI
jgi:hypothetical protein